MASPQAPTVVMVHVDGLQHCNAEHIRTCAGPLLTRTGDELLSERKGSDKLAESVLTSNLSTSAVNTRGVSGSAALPHNVVHGEHSDWHCNTRQAFSISTY